MPKKINMTGWIMKEHGVPDSLLTIIKEVEPHITSGGNKQTQYLCRCNCGKEIILKGAAIRNGNTKSCGCLSKEAKQAKRLPNNKGIINQIILQYKRHARDRNLSWNLTYEQVEKIIQEPCFYCGAEKSNHKVTKNCKEGYDHNGIDRIDSSVGYEPNNVVSCCKICNYAKSNLTKEDFINWAIRVAEHSKAMAEQWGGDIR